MRTASPDRSIISVGKFGVECAAVRGEWDRGAEGRIRAKPLRIFGRRTFVRSQTFRRGESFLVRQLSGQPVEERRRPGLIASRPLLQRDRQFLSDQQPLFTIPPDRMHPFPGNKIPLTRISPIALGLLNYLPTPNEAVSGDQPELPPDRVESEQHAKPEYARQRYDRTKGYARGGVQSFRSATAPLTYQVFRLLRFARRPGYQYEFQLAAPAEHPEFQQRHAELQSKHEYHDPAVREHVGHLRGAGDSGHFAQSSQLRAADAELHTNYSSLSDTNAPDAARSMSYGLADNVTDSHREALTGNFGGGIRRHYLNNTITDQNGRGTFTFSGLPRRPVTDSSGRFADFAGTGYDFADFLLGSPGIDFGPLRRFERTYYPHATASTRS